MVLDVSTDTRIKAHTHLTPGSEEEGTLKTSTQHLYPQQETGTLEPMSSANHNTTRNCNKPFTLSKHHPDNKKKIS